MTSLQPPPSIPPAAFFVERGVANPSLTPAQQQHAVNLIVEGLSSLFGGQIHVLLERLTAGFEQRIADAEFRVEEAHRRLEAVENKPLEVQHYVAGRVHERIAVYPLAWLGAAFGFLVGAALAVVVLLSFIARERLSLVSFDDRIIAGNLLITLTASWTCLGWFFGKLLKRKYKTVEVETSLSNQQIAALTTPSTSGV